MEFLLKLARALDDEKLKGMSFNGIDFGAGKDRYYIEGDDDDEYSEPNEELWNCATDLMDKIGAILPDARICYQSIESEGSGESYVACKMENDPNSYWCSTVCGNHPFGSDEWCAQVKKQAAEMEGFDEDDE